ncbi:hypothetical protein DOY81_001596 [Sarcophaga bullata]|nr:hypothetical protein DOY81_001596 [Sarcophaga bullata]
MAKFMERFEEEEVFQIDKPQSEVEHDTADVPLEKLKEHNDNKGDGRSIADSVKNSANFENQSKPLRSIFLGIYKNYKSTYLGNKTLTEYKQSLRENMKNKQQLQPQNIFENESKIDHDNDDDGVVTEYLTITEASPTETIILTTAFPPEKQPSKPIRKRKNATTTGTKQNATKTDTENQLYNVGPALNMSLDMANSIIKVNLDSESLRELVTGRWLNDNTDEGRGKKYEMVTRILPLFILPFLIQSAIVPFLVTKLKNSNKQMQTYEVAPSYWAGEPSRRSELAAAASNMAYNGYRVEGKPAAWIN